jgi:hypothetical protein
MKKKEESLSIFEDEIKQEEEIIKLKVNPEIN